MTFWTRPKKVVVLGGKSLSVAGQQLDFPEEVVANLEVIDNKRFGEILESFLIIAKGFGKVVVALAPEVVFSKTFEGKYDSVMEGEIKKFLDGVPLLPEKIARKIVTEENGFSVWATNRELYAAVVSALVKNGLTVEAVTPTGTTNNFLIGKEELNWEPGGFNLKRLIMIMGIAVGVVAVALAVKGLLTRSSDDTPSPVATTIKEEQKIESVVFFKELKDIKVLVLNGTGAPGIAGRTAKILEKLGYMGVTTGNAKPQNETETKVTVTNAVSPETLSGLKGELEKVFEKIVVAATPSASVDILIVTGK
ncbi:MAG: LytR C-terminal domain-containing protein [Patescibacteria group bacterium]